MNATATIQKARTRSVTSRHEWLAIRRTDHPHVAGDYFYIIDRASVIDRASKHAWTPSETLLAAFIDGEDVTADYATPIMVRARITRDEWEALRILALRRNTAPADLIAAAIRSTVA